MRLLLSAFVFLAVAAVASAAPVPKETLEKLPNFFPLLPGTEWQYGSGEEKRTMRVKDYVKKDGVCTATIVTYMGGRESNTEQMRVDENGVSRTHINGQKIEPPLMLLKFGIQDGAAWDAKSTLGSQQINVNFKLAGMDEMKLPTGKCQAVKVNGIGEIGGTKVETTYHFAEGIGVVKLTYTLEGTQNSLMLSKFTPGKEEKK